MNVRSVWVPACLSALVAVAVYANTLGHGFVIDDIPQVKENPWLDGADRVPEVFTKGVWDFEGRSSSYYRPFMYVVYIATAQIAGREPFAFHLVNVAFHAMACALAALAAAALRRSLDPGAPTSAWIPWVAGIGFAVHPIHTEVVAWVAGMADLGFGVCALASIWIYAHSDGRRGLDTASAALYLAAMLFKEPAVLLPLILVSVDLLARGNGNRARRAAMRMVPFAAAIAVYLVLRTHALGGLAPTATDLGLGVGAQTRTTIALSGRYLAALVQPFPQNFWHAFEVPATWTRPDVLLAFVALAAYSALAAIVRSNRLAVWGLLAILPPLLPSLMLRGLNQGLENAFAERYLYVPSFGFTVALAAIALASAAGSARRSRVILGGILALGIGASLACIDRNRAWHDHVSLWSDAASKSPHSGIAQQNLGFALLGAGREEEAATCLRRALELRPDLPELARAKADHYERVGLPRKAAFSYLSALQLNPNDVAARWGLARQYVALGWKTMAEAEYSRVIAADPALPDAQNELGILLAERGELAAALARFETAGRLRPDDPHFARNAERARVALGESR